ncbi:MAG: B12-binding domain-containing protein [Planctomycetota bacterium]
MLSTSDFAAAIGMSESSVRRLADRGELEIHRTHGGHRRIPVSEAIRYVRETGASVMRPDVLGLVNRSINSRASQPAKNELLEALLEGHASAVLSVMQSLYASGTSLAEICDGPIREAMAVIGERWPNDKRSIFLEHRATVLCVRALCQIRMAIPFPDEGAPTAMGGAPQDDPYMLPSVMVSLLLHDCGYDETNLGPNTPIDVLTDSVQDEEPSIVWLALSNPIRSRHLDREIERLGQTVEAYGGTFFIGGKHAATYQGESVVRCQSMTELKRRVDKLALS